ncbi:MAG: SIS domain-containing protein [Clostridia bacterium]|nr:SIS domain-containing protein [Clostridia bacterium]
MLKLNVQEKTDNIRGALQLRGKIEEIADEILLKGFDTLYFIGIGGTWASALQVESYIKSQSCLPVAVENAAEYITTGNRRLGDRSVVVFSSVSGSTQEIVAAVEKAKTAGARVFGFIDKTDATLIQRCDFCISYPGNEQLKFFMLANYLMFKNGEFPEYERYNREMEAHLPEALVQVECDADRFASEYAREKYLQHKLNPDKPHYFIGAGTQWGATYSHAMCYWEEQLWLRTKSISAGEFFHGTLEIIDAETPVTLFIGEDAQRPLCERVKNFLPKVCRNYLVIDSKDYALDGISEEFRASVSHLVLRAVNNRIDVHLEKELCHPMDIRRYYRQFDY